MQHRLLSIALLMALPAGTGAAGDAELDRATIRGLKAVGVVIDHIDQSLPREGVSATLLQERIEARLKEANIEVNRNAQEFVGIQVTAVRGSRGPYALAYTIGLYQPVILAREAKMRTVTKTWEVETILMAEPKALREASLESMDDLAARFVAAWRGVNQEK
jgi:hypothetical protein